MEESTKRIIEIEVDLGASQSRLAEVTKELDDLKKNSNELKKENAELLQSVRDGEKAWSDVSKQIGENSRQIAENEAKTKQLKAEQSTLNGQIAESAKKNRVYGDSFKELSAKLTDMKNAYRSLDKEQRQSEGGRKMLAEIQQLDAEMKGADASIGNFQRNVGDYAGQISKISGLFGAGKGAAGNFATGIAGVTAGFKALTGVPIIAVISVVVTLFQKVTNAIKGSEEQTMRLREAMAPLNPLIDLVKNGLSALADIIVKVVTTAVNGLIVGLDGLARAMDWVGGLFGADWGLSEKTGQMRAASDAARELTKAENDYALRKRQWLVEEAKIDREVADLREKASDKEKYSAQQRMEFLDKAIALETKKAATQKELAEENLRITKLEAARTSNDAEMNDRLAEAERAVIEADKQLSDTKRTLQKQRNSTISEIRSHTKVTREDTKAIEDNTAELERQAEEYRKLTIAEIQKAEDALNNIIEDEFEKRRAIEDTAYQRRHDKLVEAMVAEEEAHGMETELYRAYMTQWEALEEQHSQNLLAIENDRIAKEQAVKEAAAKKDAERIKKEIELEYKKYENIASITGSIGDILESAADDNEALVAASKIAALAEVAIQQGIAISKAVAAAADVPYPGNILAIASSVASALAAIVPALKSINSAKLARGTSYVQGPGTGTSDSVPAMLSRGEGVVTAKANSMFPGVVGAMNDASIGIWSPLMSMLRNSGGAPAQVISPAMMYSTFGENWMKAVSGMKLVVSVEEINRVQGSVQVVENLGSI